MSRRQRERESAVCCRVIHVGTLTFRGAVCLPALIAACHSQASDQSAVWPLSYVCADRKKKFNLEGFYRDAVFPDVYLFVSQTMNKLREARNFRLLLSFLCCFQVSDPSQAPQLRTFLNLEVVHRYTFPRMSPPIHFISFFSFLNLVKIQSLASSPLFLPRVSAWISLITSRSFVFNRLKTHFNTADISRALRAFLPILTQFKLFSWRHFTLTSRTAALGGTEGSGQRSGQSFRAIYLMDFALDVWNTSLNSASGHSIGVCMHARVCVYMSCMCFKVTVLKGKCAGTDPLNVWKLGIFTLYRENT